MNDKSARFPKGTRIKDTAPERRAILDLLEEQGKPLQRKAIVERLARSAEPGDTVLVPAPAFPVHIYAAIIAGGLEVESYHPGPNPLNMLSHTLRTVFMSCFPQINQLQDFGPMRYKRVTEVSGQTAA